MSLYLDIANYVLFMVTADDSGSPVVVLQQCVAGDFTELARIPVDSGTAKYRLAIELANNDAHCEIVEAGKPDRRKAVGNVGIAFLSGGFTGNFIGLDAIDMYRRNSSAARFTNFEYEVL
jgi:xylan 1,4-beta-xylosidase